MSESTAQVISLMERFGVPAEGLDQLGRAQVYEALGRVIALFEGRLKPQQVARRGAVYTPEPIVRRLIVDGAAFRSDRRRAPRFLDPACGPGAFLLGALRWLEEQHGVFPEESLGRLVRGVDVSPEAVAQARAVLSLLLLSRGADPAPAEKAVVCADALLTPADELIARTFGRADRRPELICTNPPYIRLQNLAPSLRKRVLAAFPDQLRGNFSLSTAFALRALDWSAPGGCVGLITQNNVFTSRAGHGLRALWRERRAVRRIVDFGSRHVFPGASAYTCLVYFGPRPTGALEFARVQDRDLVRGLDRVRYSRIRFTELGPDRWRLAPAENLADLARLERLPLRLGDLCRIRVGFATLKDKAYLLRQDGDRWLGTTPGGRAIEVERWITRPAIKVADLNEESDLDPTRRRILFPYDGGPDRPVLLGAQKIQRDAPGAWALLSAWRQALLARDGGRVDPARFWAWGRNQSMRAPGPKLLTKTFSRRPAFFLDPSDSLFCNGYALTLPRPEASPIDLRLLQRILNSAVMHYFACLTSVHIEGGYQCYQKNFIERFRMPDLDRSAARDLSMMPPQEFEVAWTALCGLDGARLAAFVAAHGA